MMVNWDWYWNLLSESWNSLGTWTMYGDVNTEISPVGQLRFLPEFGKTAGRMKDIGDLPNQYTVEMRVKIDDWGDHFEFNGYNGDKVLLFQIYSTHIKFGVGIFQYNISTDNNWHIWRCLVDTSIPEVTVYRDNVFVYTYTGVLWIFADFDGLVQVGMKETGGGEAHQDYIRIASGLHSEVITAQQRRAEKIAELHRLYGAGPYTDVVKEAYSDVLVEVSQYNEDGTWDSHNRRGRTIGDRDIKTNS